LGVDLEGRKDVLGHWIGNGGEGSNFWLSVVKDLQARGVKDIFIACIDGLQGFREAITAIFPRVLIQRCIIHQIRNSLKYVSWRDRKEFAADLKTVYTAVNREAGELALLGVAEKCTQEQDACKNGSDQHLLILKPSFVYTIEKNTFNTFLEG